MQQGAQFQEYRENRILLYDNTLRYVDHAIEKFYTTLKDIGLLDSTIIIITADHGEEFWEHAGLEAENFYDPRGCCGVGHGHNVFNEIIEIPLLISAPAISNIQSNRLISMVDIMPTILDFLNVDDSTQSQGTSLLPAIEGEAIENPILLETMFRFYETEWLNSTPVAVTGLRTGEWKLVYATMEHDGKPAWIGELYNVRKDPLEVFNVMEENPETFRRLMNQMHSMSQAYSENALTGNKYKEMDEETRRKLKSLGYLK